MRKGVVEPKKYKTKPRLSLLAVCQSKIFGDGMKRQ
jgi:hypothetical protein